MARISILLIVLLSLSCVNNASDSALVNTSWTYCDENFGHSEVTFYNDTMWWCTEFDPYGIPYKYQIISDSVCELISTVNGKSAMFSYDFIFNLDDSIVEMKFIDSNQTIRAKKIQFEPFFFNDTIFLKNHVKGFNNRSVAAKCTKKNWQELGDLELPSE
jgi:hypothetical protein